MLPVSTIRAITCALLYGIMENRFMFEGGGDKHSMWIFNHFKTYHFLMFLLFAAISFDSACMIWLWNLIAMPFIQDFSWQIIEGRKLKQEDWSNVLKLPLFFNVYVHYWLSCIALVVLGIIIVFT